MTPDNLTREDKYPSGIVGLSVGEIERQVHRRRGASAAAQRAIGCDREVSSADQWPRQGDGRCALYGRYHAAWPPAALATPHAGIVSIDTKMAERHPDVRAVHVITDLVGGATKTELGSGSGWLRSIPSTKPGIHRLAACRLTRRIIALMPLFYSLGQDLP